MRRPLISAGAACATAIATIAVMSGAPSTASVPVDSGTDSAYGCSLWALADVVDGKPEIYAGGGVNCDPAEAKLITVSLYQDGQLVHEATSECGMTTACATNTPTAFNPDGLQEWCARTWSGGDLSNPPPAWSCFWD
ncbi:hypothetical protein [Solicola gregarius]|uniref:Secreted protein n=1 Tax=Solicola gregarius TaxID=2908642 RepID=A0AA46YN75_9ACTN|nr:hypothetical protein [Solicola gregarius]UYM07196.1 hypothetical protein L0C25_09000 [Solicola gregarius]